MTGGAGNDTFVGEIDNAAKVASKAGNLSLDVITDFQSGIDKIDLAAIDANGWQSGDQAFNWKNYAANKAMGDLSLRTYDSINGAENAMGIDLDGIDGPGAAGPVTVVLGNVDGGTPDFAIVLLGVSSVQQSDFIF
jgi:serralysin